MNILFIGGTGNISLDCAALLAARGHKVSILTRGWRAVPSEFRALVADRHDADAIRLAIGGDWPDVVINFLGYTLDEAKLDHAIFAGKISQYIFISTAMVYAKPHCHLPISEDSPRGNPFSDYAQQKHLCEDWLMAKCRSDKFPVTIVRPSHTYSKRWIPNPVKSEGYTLLKRLELGKPVFVHGEGQNLWTLTATTDFAVGIAGLAGNTGTVGEAFHITSDEVLTWNQIYAETVRAAGIRDAQIIKIPTWFICREVPHMIGSLMGDKAEHGVFDNAKIKKWVPDFACHKTYREGIAEAVRWFREDPSRQTINVEADAVFDKVISAWQAR